MLREFLFPYISKDILCFIYGCSLSKTRVSIVLILLHCTKSKEGIKRIIIIIIISGDEPICLCTRSQTKTPESPSGNDTNDVDNRSDMTIEEPVAQEIERQSDLDSYIMC